MHSCHEDALKEATKAKFKPTKLVKVSRGLFWGNSNVTSPSFQVRFVGKGAIDLEEPRREFFRLLTIKAIDVLFRGPQNKKLFDTNVPAIQVR